MPNTRNHGSREWGQNVSTTTPEICCDAQPKAVMLVETLEHACKPFTRDLGAGTADISRNLELPSAMRRATT